MIPQEHDLRKCQSVCHKIKNILAGWKWFWAFEDPNYHYFYAIIRNIKYAINLIGIWQSVVCQSNIEGGGGGTRKNLDRGARVIFWGLKFDRLLFFGLLKMRIIFGG